MHKDSQYIYLRCWLCQIDAVPSKWVIGISAIELPSLVGHAGASRKSATDAWRTLGNAECNRLNIGQICTTPGSCSVMNIRRRIP